MLDSKIVNLIDIDPEEISKAKAVNCLKQMNRTEYQALAW